jgi:Flp pilus assembly pilin Flp
MEKQTKTTRRTTMKLTAMKIAKAKKTWFGRMLCRVLGDERGAVMMEYVVLGVLVVAAAVAVVLVFGRQIRDNFHGMILAMQGKEDTAKQYVEGRATSNASAADAAEDISQSTAGGEYDAIEGGGE